MAPFELDGLANIVAITATDSLRVVAGSFWRFGRERPSLPAGGGPLSVAPPMVQKPPAARSDGPPVRLRAAFWVLLAALLAIAFWPTPGCQFVFDDIAFLVNNDTITDGDLLAALFGRQQLMANRPVTGFALALQYRLFGGEALYFRWVSVLLHLVNVRMLFAVVHSSLLSPNLAGRFTLARAWWLAAAIAALWGLHPLTVETVAYTVQQSMLLMVLFLLAAMRMLQRAHAAPHAAKCSCLAILFVALGMATKEEMAPAPLLLVLYERAFLFRDWKAMLPRWRVHLGLLGTWIVLAWCITGAINTTVGWHVEPHVSAGEWLMTQAGVVLHYLRLALWPQPLKAVYDDGIVREFARAVLPGLGVLLLLAGTVVLWRRHAPLGWLGALYFLMLAPTSSIYPIVTEVVSERRAYLPMLAVLVPAVLGIDHAIAAGVRRGWPASAASAARVGLAVVATALAIPATRAHVRTFADEATLWSHAYASNELTNHSLGTATILSGHAKVVSEQGRADEAFALFERSMQTESQLDAVRLNWGVALSRRGRFAEAEQVLRALVRDHAHYGAALGALAEVLWQRFLAAGNPESPDDPRLVEAERLAEQSADLHAAPPALNTLALVLVQRGRPAEAEAALRRAIAIAPNNVPSHRNLGGVLLLVGKPAEAVALGRRLVAALPGDVDVRLNLAQALLVLGDAAGAVPVLEDVLRIDPGNAQAQGMLAQIRTGGR
jgi:tetratricopeptide (TPR) repeat protein